MQITGPVQRMELKYCEGCGELQIRRVDSGRVYCARCEAELERRAGSSIREMRKRPPKLTGGLIPELQGCVEELLTATGGTHGSDVSAEL